MRLPRFRLQTLMIAVVMIGLLIGSAVKGERLVRRSRYYRYEASLYGISERRMRGILAQTEGQIARCKDHAAVRARWERSGLSVTDVKLFIRDDRALIRRAALERREVAYHARMRKRFEQAFWRPWLIVRREPMPE
jgi:hypothetical protein